MKGYRRGSGLPPAHHAALPGADCDASERCPDAVVARLCTEAVLERLPALRVGIQGEEGEAAAPVAAQCCCAGAAPPKVAGAAGRALALA